MPNCGCSIGAVDKNCPETDAQHILDVALGQLEMLLEEGLRPAVDRNGTLHMTCDRHSHRCLNCGTLLSSDMLVRLVADEDGDGYTVLPSL